MSGQVSFTYIPPNLRIPLFSVEFDNSQAGANQDIQRAVLVGGTLITQPVAAVYVATVAEAIALFGASSMLASMMAAYLVNERRRGVVPPDPICRCRRGRDGAR